MSAPFLILVKIINAKNNFLHNYKDINIFKKIFRQQWFWDLNKINRDGIDYVENKELIRYAKTLFLIDSFPSWFLDINLFSSSSLLGGNIKIFSKFKESAFWT